MTPEDPALWEIAFDLAWKTAVTATVLTLVSRIAERLGAFMASILMAFPNFAGPGYFFIALEAPAEFIAEGALLSFAAAGGVLVFMAVYAHAIRFGRLLAPMAIASLAWLVFAAPMAFVEMTLWLAFAAVALGALFARSMQRRFDIYSAPVGKRTPWGFLVFRAVLAGLVVALVATGSQWMGPVLAGIAFGYPVTTGATVWLLTSLYGPKFAAATIQSAQISLVNYGGFCLALHLAALHLPALTAWGVAILVPFATGAALAWFGYRARRRALA